MSADSVPLRVLIVDDQHLLADSLRVALRVEGIETVVASISDLDTLLAKTREDPPTLVLLDLDLGSGGDGTSLVAPFLEAGARVLVMTGSMDEDWIAAALEQGACAAVDKAVGLDELVPAVLSAARGETVLAPAERERRLLQLRSRRAARARELAPFETLTPREQQVLRALSEGLTVPRIAEAWFVSEATVRSQVHAILRKLDVRSQLEAVAAAMRVGWV